MARTSRRGRPEAGGGSLAQPEGTDEREKAALAAAAARLSNGAAHAAAARGNGKHAAETDSGGFPAALAAGAEAADRPAGLSFHIDEISDERIGGWIFNPRQPAQRCIVALKDAGEIVARTVASHFRADLAAAGIGDGCHAFTLSIPPAMRDGAEHPIEIVEQESGTPLSRDPIRWHAAANERSPATLEEPELAIDNRQPRPAGAVADLTSNGAVNLENTETSQFKAFVDGFDPEWVLAGWAFDPHGREPLSIDLEHEDRVVATAVARLFRQDLADAGIGDGKCAFRISLPDDLFDGQAHDFRLYAANANWHQLIFELSGIELPAKQLKNRRGYASYLRKKALSGETSLIGLIEACHALVKGQPGIDLFTNSETQFASSMLRMLLERIINLEFDFAELSTLSASCKIKLLELLTELRQWEALRYVLGAMPVGPDEQQLRRKIIDSLFSGHLGSWYENVDFLFEKILLNEGAVAEAAQMFHPKPDLFLALKRYEIAHLLAYGHWFQIDEVIAQLRRAAAGHPSDIEAAERAAGCQPGIFVQRPLFVQHPIVKAVEHLCLFAPEFVREMMAHFSDGEIRNVLHSLITRPPVYLVVTEVSYPMGGGESFMYQTCKLLSELGFKCVWASFHPAGGEPYVVDRIIETPWFIDVRSSDTLTTAKVEQLIARYSADIVHAQGPGAAFAFEASERTRVPIIAGFHFWDGLVELGPNGNRHMLANSEQHRAGSLVAKMAAAKIGQAYVASEFMNEVLQAIACPPLSVCHPTSDPSHFQAGLRYDPLERDYILQLNIHELKGGRILLHLIDQLGREIPFTVVQSEPGSDELDALIRDALNANPKSRYLGYSDVKQLYAGARLVLVPTLVDETFCRVAFEATMNGIPVLCTKNGFLPHLYGDTGLFLDEDDPPAWTEQVRKLYGSPGALVRLGAAQYEHVSHRFFSHPTAFVQMVAQALKLSPRRNIGFIAPWSDQGLGIQVRHYSSMLRPLGYRTHVLSFQPYGAVGRSVTNQKIAGDWAVGSTVDTIHYSLNTREELTDHEIKQFTLINNIGLLIYPEVCWRPNWEKLRKISVVNLFIAAVPNIETVRKGEIADHKIFSRILCNTKVCESLFISHGMNKIHYIGHGFGSPLSDHMVRNKARSVAGRDVLRYVHVGGHNPRTRKQTRKVINAFRLALLRRNDIELTVTVMSGLDELSADIRAFHDRIRILNGDLGHSEILELYRDSDVSIQVSSHEGLGLGFYESVAMLTPVISLDTAPHNEIIRDGETGWLLPVKRVPLPDNDDPVFYASEFSEAQLAALITRIEKQEVVDRVRQCAPLYNGKFTNLHLQARLIGAIF